MSGPVSFIKSPWTHSFHELVSTAERNLLLVSPFIKSEAVDDILYNLQGRGVDKDIFVGLLTNLRPESILNGSTDMEAVSLLSRTLPRFQLVHLPSLHAKAYIADDAIAVITSANLTQPGMAGNLEYGVAFRDRSVVREIRRDFQGYAGLGAHIGPIDIDLILHEASKLKEADFGILNWPTSAP